MKRNEKRFQRWHSVVSIVTGLAAIYGVATSILIMLRGRIGEDNKRIGLFNSFAHILMLPSAVLLPINLWLSPRTAWSHVLPAVNFIRRYGGRFAPKKVNIPAPNTPHIRVLTFNLHGEADRLMPILDILRTADADVIAVQELSLEAAGCFEALLGSVYPHQSLYGNEIASRGQGVLSKHPIVAHEFWRNPEIAKHSLGHLRVEIDFAGKPITVYNTHPLHPGMANEGFSTRPRGKEIEIVLAKAAQDTGAVLIMGDFNMTDQNEDYDRITAAFGDAFHAVGRGMGFTFPDLSTFQALPSYWPLPIRLFLFLRLDYVFYNEAFVPITARVWPTAGGSDHRPVWVKLALLPIKFTEYK